MSQSHTVVGCNCLCCQTEREEERERKLGMSALISESPPSLSAIFGSQWEGNEDTELQYISGTKFEFSKRYQ